jgi:rhodanese-related sulfurtransferase
LKFEGFIRYFRKTASEILKCFSFKKITKENLLKFIIENWMLIAVALGSGALLVLPVLQGLMDSGLSPNLVVQLINKERALLVDVREESEFKVEHIVNSQHVPLSELESRLPQVHKNKATPLVLVCASGIRSAKAVQIAKKLGYQEAHSLSGGLKSWKEVNLPTEGVAA